MNHGIIIPGEIALPSLLAIFLIDHIQLQYEIAILFFYGRKKVIIFSLFDIEFITEILPLLSLKAKSRIRGHYDTFSRTVYRFI